MRYDAWIMYIERNKKPGTFRVYQAFVDEILCFLPVIRHPACDGSCYIVAVGGEDLCVLAVDKPAVKPLKAKNRQQKRPAQIARAL